MAWLTPFDGNVFHRVDHWAGAAPIVLDSAAEQIHAPRASDVLPLLDMSALHLQSLFENRTGTVVAQSRYHLRCLEHARQVATDLLDVLLMTDPVSMRYSALSEFAGFLNIPLSSSALSVRGQSVHSMRIRHVQTLEARAFAMAITDALMFASARLDEPDEAIRVHGVGSLRVNWLWPFMPQSALLMLCQRARNWPHDYARACWPELESAERSPLLQSSKKDLQRHLLRANPPTFRHQPSTTRRRSSSQ